MEYAGVKVIHREPIILQTPWINEECMLIGVVIKDKRPELIITCVKGNDFDLQSRLLDIVDDIKNYG